MLGPSNLMEESTSIGIRACKIEATRFFIKFGHIWRRLAMFHHQEFIVVSISAHLHHHQHFPLMPVLQQAIFNRGRFILHTKILIFHGNTLQLFYLILFQQIQCCHLHLLLLLSFLLCLFSVYMCKRKIFLMDWWYNAVIYSVLVVASVKQSVF